MSYAFKDLNKETLKELYSNYGVRPKEIGQIVGLSEDAIRNKIKSFGIDILPRDKKRTNIKIIYTGHKRDKKNLLTEDVLRSLCKDGKTDEEIGRLFGMTGVGVAYRREKYGIRSSKESKDIRSKLKSTSKEILEKDYNELNTEDFSNKYGVSKVVWRPYLKSLGIESKSKSRIDSYPSFTKEQRALIIGSLLGDGSVSSGIRYYEAHNVSQIDYLKKKFKILLPYSSSFSPDLRNTQRLTTVAHPNFKEFYNNFYKEGIKGKGIPMDFIRNEWCNEILAYWYLDDGSYDDINHTFYIYNYTPDYNDLENFTEFLEDKYKWGFVCGKRDGIFYVTISRENYRYFFDIIKKVATPDMYYKIPEKYLDKEIMKNVNICDDSRIRGKHYRLGSEDQRVKIKNKVIKDFRDRGFPFISATEDRKIYLLNEFRRSNVKSDDSVITVGTPGTKLCEIFFPNMYECRRKSYKSPVDSWVGDEYLSKVVEYVLNKYDYVGDESVRSAIKRSSACVSNFKPNIAKFIYDRYGGGGKVLDYSSGFGSRMLACMCLGMEYTGFDPNKKTCENLNAMGSFLSKHTKGKFVVNCNSFEDSEIQDSYYDLAFSCPPYFNYEVYGDDDGQSVYKYPIYKDWLVNYWGETIKKSLKSLKDGGHFAVCLHPVLCHDMIRYTFEVCSKNGFSFIEDYKVPYKDSFSKYDKYEVVFVFSRDKVVNSPRFWNKYEDISKLDISLEGKDSLKDDLFSDNTEKKFREEITEEMISKAKDLFRLYSEELGTSRSKYKDRTLLGLEPHSLEYIFGSWNKFVYACGITPGYEAKGAKAHVSEYLSYCYRTGSIISFHDYGKAKGEAYKNRVKRLFNSGKKYSHLKDELFRAASDKSLYLDFMENFES